MFGVGIPFEFSAEPHRNLAEQTDGARAVPNLYRSDGFGTRLDTFEPVRLMVITLIQPDFIGADGRSQQRFRLGVDLPACDINPALGSFKEDTPLVLFIVGADDLDAVGVGVLDTEIAVYVPGPVLRIFGLPLDFDRAGVFGSHAPLGDVVMVGAPAGNHTGAISGDSQPARPAIAALGMDALLGICRPRRRAQPHPT